MATGRLDAGVAGAVVRFDARNHTYWVGDRRLPSVTEVIKASGRWYEPRSRAAMLRGRRLHALTALADRGEPLPAGAPHEVAGLLAAYARFLRLLRATPERREVPQARADLGYAGTPDWEGRVMGLPTLVDLKTGAPADWHRVQTAAYDLLDPARSGRQRMAVYLHPNGRFHVEPHPSRGDYGDWLGLLAEYRAAAEVRAMEERGDGEAQGDDDDWWE